MQEALNAAGYRDESGAPLNADGVWGKKSMQALLSLVSSVTAQKSPDAPRVSGGRSAL